MELIVDDVFRLAVEILLKRMGRKLQTRTDSPL